MLAVSAGSLSSSTIWKIAGLASAIILIAIIAAVETRARARLLPGRAFNITTPLGALYLMIALLMLSMQPEIFVPYLLQNLRGQSPLWAGYLAALMAMGWTAASLPSSRWQESSGHRLIIAGPVLALVGLVSLAIFLPLNGAGDWSLLAPICLGLILIAVKVARLTGKEQ
ncbi:MAG: hypothetical protein ACRECW_13960 [Phyllobacterium sp.]